MSKQLNEYTPEEWEKVCHNCGKCCLIKLENEEDGEIYYTNVVCQYFDEKSCKCTIYNQRTTIVPECLKLNQDNVDKIKWMPKSCAYRCLVENRPCIKSSTIRGRCISELSVSENELEDHIVDWEDL